MSPLHGSICPLKKPLPVPAGVAVSPNHVLLCNVSPPSQGSRSSVYSLPRRTLPSLPAVPFPPPLGPKNELSKALCTAIYGRKSPSDVIHTLTLSTTPYQFVVSTLYGALSIMEASTFGLPGMWMDEMLGVITEVYLYVSLGMCFLVRSTYLLLCCRARAHHTEASDLKDSLNAKWKATHNVCSIAALFSAFANCKDNDVYDLGTCPLPTHRAQLDRNLVVP